MARFTREACEEPLPRSVRDEMLCKSRFPGSCVTSEIKDLTLIHRVHEFGDGSQRFLLLYRPLHHVLPRVMQISIEDIAT